MRQLLAFGKKEWLELVRSGKVLVFLILFCLFGIMNPAMAKLTPWMMEMMSESLAEAGFLVGHVTVDAMTSWTQFYKNLPILLIVVLVMFGGIFTAEVQKGTLIPIVTKGMQRWKIVACKSGVLMGVWTAGYLICYGITWGYNAYFWDNSIVRHAVLAAALFCLLGLWLLSLIPLASAFCTAQTGVLLSVGAVFCVSYVAGLFPVFADYVPTRLGFVMELLAGAAEPGEYVAAAAVTIGLVVLNEAAAALLFSKKNI